MGKVNQVLSKEDRQKIIDRLAIKGGFELFDHIITEVEQAVVAKYNAKLAEQEPVAWVAREGLKGYFLLEGAATKAFRSKEDLLEEYYKADPVPLYAHPIASHVDNKGE